MVDEHHEDLSHGISIWFFIGALLTAYGLIILLANLLPGAPASEMHVVLASLHAGIWWGVLLLIVGMTYVLLFRPGRK